MAEQKPTENPLNDDFEKFVQSTMERFHVPGVAVGVVLNDKTFTKGYGHAVLPDKPVTSQTLFYGASTTKSFTAAAVALVLEENKTLNWNTPISSIIRDDFVLQDEYMTNHITLEDAACHRTSIPSHEECYGDADKNVRDVVRRMRYLPLMDAPFRTKYQYCNLGYLSLQVVVEKLSGMTLEDYLRKKIWSPLGMVNTCFAGSAMEEKAQQGEDLARGYMWDEDNEKYIEETYMDMTLAGGAGANVSNVLDYTKWLQMMLKKSEPLSSKIHNDLRRPRMLTGKSDRPSMFQGPSAYALGWHVEMYRGVEMMYHAGGLIGFTSFMAYIPSLSFGVVLFGNGSYSAIEAMFYSLLDDQLKVPADERHDFAGESAKREAEWKGYLAGIRSQLYSLTPADSRWAMPMKIYEGTYTSPAYQKYTFRLSKRSPVIPHGDDDSDVQVLRSNLSPKTWAHIIELEHVNGPYFIAWTMRPIDGGKSEELLRGVKAEFKVEADGKVSSLGIASERSIEDKKIWFTKET